MKRNALLTLATLLLVPLAAPGEPQRMEDVSRISAGQFFRLEREAGKYRFGDDGSLVANGGGTDDLTFDVSNRRVLGNLGAAGRLKAVTIYRDSCRHCAKPESFLGGFSGVWTAMDLSSYGPYFFAVELDRAGGKPESFALNQKLPRNCRIVLLEVIFLLADRANRLPISQAGGKLTVALPAQAPDPIASVLCLETDAGVR